MSALPPEGGEDSKNVEKIGPFILGETLGKGTTGKVKLAIHHKTKQKVAIKIINKDILVKKPKTRRKIEREIAVMKLIDHPHVVRLYDVFQSKKFIFLIMELVEGGELFDYILSKGKLDFEEAFHFYSQIICGVEYCHNLLICHRDLKPENLLLDSLKNIKIGDFGMASLMEEGKLLETSCGSPHYASPEIITGIPYDGMKSDIWSLGVILFALCSGRLPFDDDDMMQLFGKVKAGAYKMPKDFPTDLQELIKRSLCVDPAKRITIAEIRESTWWKKMAEKMKSSGRFPPVDAYAPSPVKKNSVPTSDIATAVPDKPVSPGAAAALPAKPQTHSEEEDVKEQHTVTTPAKELAVAKSPQSIASPSGGGIPHNATLSLHNPHRVMHGNGIISTGTPQNEDEEDAEKSSIMEIQEDDFKEDTVAGKEENKEMQDETNHLQKAEFGEESATSTASAISNGIVSAEAINDATEDDGSEGSNANSNDPKHKVLGGIVSIPNAAIDEEIFQAIVRMGWKDEEKLRKSLEANESNIETVVYKLLAQKKLEHGCVKVEESFSPNLSVTPVNPIYDGIDSAEVLKERLLEAAKNIPVDQKKDSKKKKEKGVRWFEFWKKKKKKEENLTFGMHSFKPKKEIMTELVRALKELKIHWERKSPTTIRATCSHNNINPVEFDISLNVHPNEKGFTLTFDCVSNDPVSARIIFAAVQQEVNL